METILITGATSGIGEACARRLVSKNRKLILTGRRLDRLEKLSEELLPLSAGIYIHSFDVRNRNEVISFVESIPAGFRNVRVLLNNAGLASGLDPLQTGDPDDWDKMIDTNVKGLLYMSRYSIELLRGNEGAQIINIGSIAGKEVYPNGNVYCSTKHAVDALTRSMRMDLLPLGIRVSSVCPGLVETEFSIVRFHGDAEKASQVYKGFEPLTGEDIADAVQYMVEAPFRINVADILILPAAQASSRDVTRNSG
ncbi:MAG: SDR family NAD(P)-dependent oxidoreductase [Bacteroidetes bacterium]|nr:SDR family NAD(P)-dependent oxidoreductase [Bacteroidota bacterium]